MFNDENQEDVTLQNNVEQEETEEVETEDEEEAKFTEAEVKKRVAIALRHAKKEAAPETKTDSAPAAPGSLDQELIDLTYRNYLGGLGLTSKSVQDEAIALSKKLGVSVASLQNDEAVMAVLKQKQEIARTNTAIGKGTGGTAIRKKSVDYIAGKITSGGTIDDISGKDAVELLKRF